MPVFSREYRSDPDFLRVREFLIRTYGITGRPHNWTLERWDYCRYFVATMWGRDPQQWEADIRVWESESGQIVGVASHEARRGEVYLQIHPDHRNLENEMMEWAEEYLAVDTNDGKRRLGVRVYDYDTLRQAMVENRGYRQIEHVEHRRRRSLALPIPEPTVPEGYTVRSLREDDDLLRRCLALGRAFGSEPVDTDTYRTLQSAPGYRLDLDIVVVAPDASLAAVAIAWYDEANRIGMFEPVGTDPDHQGKGLGKAVMYEGFRRLKRLGATLAYVGTGTQIPANRLYLSVGFEEDFTDHAWTKVF
jgi:GNAT superfamily N-acetyltransferase